MESNKNKEPMKKAPKLRFKGFTDDWEQRKLSKFATVIPGGTPKTSISNYWNPSEIPWMSSGEVNNHYIYDTEKRISKLGLERSSARLIPKNSVLIALADQGKTRGKVAVNKIILSTNQSLAAIIPNRNLNFDFLYHNMTKRYSELRKLSSGTGTRGGLNKKIILNLNIRIPDNLEQKQIGSFLFKLDKLITLQQRKLQLLKQLKKGLLQKLLTESNQKSPQLRFQGFNKDWQQYQLGKLIKSEIKGKAKASMEGNKSIYLDTNFLNGSAPVMYVNSEIDVSNDDVLILWDGSQAGTVYHGFNGALGSTLKAFRPSESGEYLFQYLKANQNKIYKSFRTPNIPHVIKDFTKRFIVNVPSSSEQRQIANLLKKVDNQIIFQERYIKILKKIKQAFLQNMFI